ncbi:hypothetical protein [Anaeromusa acidaminophila]|uniref:hypothetical protein n=1 Tax=Anaeromusa acidaminophila TaxID=81464 RepID=UPI003BEF2FE9
MWFTAPIPPTGFIECNGQSTISYPTLAAIVGATVPDLRREFIRGWAHDRTGISDTGRTFGSWQIDLIKQHQHETAIANSYSPQPWGYGTINTNLLSSPSGQSTFPASLSSSYGGSETRPKNIALLPCIKY